MPSALQTACNPFSHANCNAHYSRWHPLFAIVECFYDGFTRHQGPLRQRRRPHLSSKMARSMYNLQRVIDQVMQNQLALEQLEHGIIDDPAAALRRDEAVMKTTPCSTEEVEEDHHASKQHRSTSIETENQQQKQQIELLQAEHEQEIQRLTEQHEAAVRRLTRQHDEATRRLKQEQQQALDRIGQQYKQQLIDQEETYQSRINTIEQQLSSEVLRKKQLDLLVRENGDEIKRIMAELVDQQAQVVALETKLAYRPPICHAFIQTEPQQEEKEASVQDNDNDGNDDDSDDQTQNDAIAIEQQQQQIQQLQEELLEQEERWQDKLTYYRNQVEIRMQQFYEQEYMVTRLQKHLQVVKEQLNSKKKQDRTREDRLVDMMSLVQQLREEKEGLVSQIMYYQQQHQQQRQRRREPGWDEDKHHRYHNDNGTGRDGNAMEHQATCTVPCTT